MNKGKWAGEIKDFESCSIIEKGDRFSMTVPVYSWWQRALMKLRLGRFVKPKFEKRVFEATAVSKP